MTRVGERVEQYYARARSIVCEEVVRLEPLGGDLLSDGSHVRRLVYELRVAWDAATDGARPPEAKSCANWSRSTAGRPGPATNRDAWIRNRFRPSRWRCCWRGGSASSRSPGGTPDERRAAPSVSLDYRSLTPKPPDVKWAGPCVSIDLPGRTRGRVWVDRATAEVLRLDEQLIGSVEIPVPRQQMRPGSAATFVVERADSSIRYRPIAFRDPDEIVMLPESIESLQVIRNSGVPRLRVVQRFSNYKRFITAGRSRVGARSAQ